MAASRPSIACISALVLLCAGCGGGHSRRHQVERYITDANAVQQRASAALVRANRTYVAFARRKLSGSAAATRLAGAEAAIRTTRAALARLRPPPDARVLQQRLLHLYDLDAGLAGETTALARYLPAAQRALAPLPRINASLHKGLTASKSPARQARALASFATGVGRLMTALRALDPPPLLAPTHRAQLERLTRTHALALELRHAIEGRNAKAVARVLVRFRRLASQAANRGSGLERSALTGYDRRYLTLRTAAAAVERERTRLERALR